MSATHTSVCKLASAVNSRVTSARVHTNVCSLASVEQASGVWDVTSEQYSSMSPPFSR